MISTVSSRGAFRLKLLPLCVACTAGFSSPFHSDTIASSAPDAPVAFTPHPLPPKWDWPESLWPLLVEERTCLASLDGTGKHLFNPEILLWPLQNREAQLSSKLEGTITDPTEQALFQADPRYPVSESDPNNAFREVFNYRRALRLRLDGTNDLPLSKRLVRELHEVLMDGVRGYDPLVRSFLVHYQFETIHPFAAIRMMVHICVKACELLSFSTLNTKTGQIS